MSLASIDLMLRSGAIVLLLLIAAMMARDVGRVTAGRLAIGFALGAAAFAVSSAPGFSNQSILTQDILRRAPLIALSTGNVIVFWLFARALFDDGFRPPFSWPVQSRVQDRNRRHADRISSHERHVRLGISPCWRSQISYPANRASFPSVSSNKSASDNSRDQVDLRGAVVAPTGWRHHR